jgi:hypothetical protein
MGSGIYMDHVIISISQTGHTGDWYQILNWGDDISDENVNPNMNSLGILSEPDNHPIEGSYLHTAGYSTGIRIELDGYVPAGTYYYIQIHAPSGDHGDGTEIDAIQVLP